MNRKLYELAAADETVLFSPYCWRVRLALAHKNLRFESVPWHFTEKERIAFSGQGMVPVLVDGKKVVHDSWLIAEYLEETYTNEPSLFGDAAQRALTRFVKEWSETMLHPAITRVILPDIFPKLAEKDKGYFRETREARLGMTIEAMRDQRATCVPAFEAALVPVRNALKAQAFLCGEGPGFADHIVFGALKWATMMSSTRLVAADDVVAGWMGSLLEGYGLS